jgi:uncharacterized protein YjdB
LEIKKILRDQKGDFAIWAVVIVMVLLIFATAGFENIRLQIIAQGTRDRMQTIITQMCTDNYNRVYNGLREGYSGGYKLESTTWTENVDTGDLYAKLDKLAGTLNGEKAANGKTEYKITNLSAQISNAQFAPTSTDDIQQFTGNATYTLTVPLSFGWQSLPPMVISMKVSGGYSSKGTISGSVDSTDQGKNATGISLSESQLTLEKGAIETLAASVSPEDATDSLSWVATNPNVCSVDNTGTIIAKSVGQSTIVATAVSGNAVAQCNVTVINAVTGISLNKSNLTLVKGSSETLYATITPADATNKSGMWASSDASVCTVDQSGNVLAVNAGTAVVSATTQDGSYVAQCTVTVTIPNSSISLNKTETLIVPGGSETLIATVYPADATKQTVLWASSNEDVCTVDQSGKISAIVPGTSIVSATTFDGQYTATCTVTVSVPVTGVNLNKTYLTLIKGTNETLYATVWPTNATNKAVTWSTSNSSIATVDQSGKVTGVGVGSATIRVTTKDGGFYDEAFVNVTPDEYTVTANAVHGQVYGTGTYHVGSTVTLTAVADPHYHFVSWTNASGVVIGGGTTYTINNLNANTTVTANFAIDMFTINVDATTGGKVSGGGTYPYNTVITIKATPYDKYKFVGWSDGSPDAERTFAVTGNASYTAIFKPLAYTWTSTHTSSGADYTSVSVSNSSTYSSDAWYSCSKSGSRDCTSYSTYTFTTPTVFKAGSVLYMVVGIRNAPKMSILINGTSCATAIGGGEGHFSASDTYILRYVIPSDITISTITITGLGSPSNNASRHSCAALFITPVNDKTFMLNSTNTSENQDYSNSYYADSPSKDGDKYNYTSFYSDSIHFREGTSRYSYFHFLRPRAISYITLSGNYDHVTSVSLNMGDVYGHTATFTSSLTSKVPTATVFPSSYQQLNTDNLTDFELNCKNGWDDVNINVTVYFKDGSSVVIGTNTLAGSLCG